MKYFLITFSFLAMLASCSKSPGVGGKATISGTLQAIYVEEGSFDTVEISAYPDQRIYIIYGNGSTQDDDTRTSPDGSFKFEYLNPGDYSIFAYSETLLTSSEIEPIYKSVNIGKSQDDVNLGAIYVVKYVK
ncbi:MAG: hypothetical protein ACPGVC_03880 [Salibacteraceae bacterium]